MKTNEVTIGSYGIKTIKRVYFILAACLFWLVLHDGLRWEIGTDWDSYYNFFHRPVKEDHYEIGYYLLMSIFRSFTNKYTVYLLAQASFTYCILYVFLKNYSIYPLVSLCVFYCTMLGFLGCNRQLIALTICLISFKYIIDRDFKRFILCLLIAFLFHATSIVFVFSYFVCNQRFKAVFIWLALAVCIAINITGMINNIPFINYFGYLGTNIAEKSSYYINNDTIGFTILGTMKRCLLIECCLKFRNSKKDEAFYNLFLNLYVIGAIIYVSFIGTPLGLIAGRGALYYNITEILLIPYIIRGFYKQYGKSIAHLLWLVIFIFLLYIMHRDMKSYEIAYDLQIYNPYKSVLF